MGGLRPIAPDGAAARSFGAALARTHAADAAAFGCAPEGWHGDGFFGPAAEPLPLRVGAWPTWGSMYADARVEPMVRLARDRAALDAADASRVERLCARLRAGDFDDRSHPSRIHGDLWSGNVMWTAGGAVLIDAAAHGGHPETDLALLSLFGCPHLGEVLAGYEQVAPLSDGWRERVSLHQVHCLLVHAVLFGGGYPRQTLDAVARYV